MKKPLLVAGILLSAACTDTSGPLGFEAQYTIDVPGNVVGTPGCTDIDLTGCFALLDNQIKVLYETTAWAARRGEAEYKLVTSSNKDLAAIFQADTRSVAETLRGLDSFITSIDDAVENGSFSKCWGDHVLAHARWIREKVAAGNVDVSDAPRMSCFVSPVADVTVSGSTAEGVRLVLDDPWQYTGDPYGIYTTRTWFVVQGPNGNLTTDAAEQDGAEMVTVLDPATRTVGTYEYTVTQCSDWGQCSEPFSFDVDVIEGAAAPPCVHDNRDKHAPGRSPIPKCRKSKKG